MNTWLAAACAATLAAGAAQATEMKWSLWIPPMHPLVADLEAWAADVEAASEGEIDVNVYPAQQLGAAPDHYDMAADGIVEMAMVAPGYSGGRFPLWSLIELPFTFANSTAGAKVLHEWYAEYAATEMPDVKVCLVTMHHPGTVHTKGKEVRTPADLSGMRIRPAGPGTSLVVTNSGGATVQATLPEIRELAERGVVDGVTWPWDLFVIKAESVLTYHMDAPFYVTAQAQVINPAFYDALSDKGKAAIDSHCTPEWSEKVNAGWAKTEIAARDKLMGMADQTVYSLTDDEKAAWAEAAKPLTEEFHKRVSERYSGMDVAAVHARLKDLLAAAGAGY
ncbi:MAG: TRAP transporter substrate-binding protein [Pseudooceanicola sp.]|nr:TRAP transporter substrate-binding protein [Pseudooceanicola sp.]